MDSSPTPASRTYGKGKKVNVMDFFTEPPHLVERRRKAALQAASTTPNNVTRPQAQQWGKTGASQPQIIMPSAPGKDTQMATGNQEDDKTDVEDDATDIGDLKDFEEVEAEARAAGLSSEITTNFETPSHRTSYGQGQRRNGLVRQDAITPESAYQQFSSPSTSGPFSNAPLPSLLEQLAATPATPDPTTPTPAMVDDFIASALNMSTLNTLPQQHHDAKLPAGQAASNLHTQDNAASHPKFERTTPEVGGTADAMSAMQVQETPSMQERTRSSAFSAGSGFNSTAGLTFGGASSAQTQSAWGTGSNQQPQAASSSISFSQTLENDLAQFGFGTKATRARATDQAKTTTGAWTSTQDHQESQRSAPPEQPTQRTQIQAPNEASQEGKFQFQPLFKAPSSTQPEGLQEPEATKSTPQPNMTAVAPQSTFSFNNAFSFSTTGGFSVNPAPSTSAATTWNPKTQNSVAFNGAPSTSAATTWNPKTQNSVAFNGAPSKPAATNWAPNTQNSVAFNGAPSKPAAMNWAPSTQNDFAFGAVPSTSTTAIGDPNTQNNFAAQQVWAPPPPKVLTDFERCNLWWAEMSKRVAFDEEQKRVREAKAREEAAKMKAPVKTPPFVIVTGPAEKGKVEEVKGVRVRPEEIIPGNVASEYYKKMLESEEAFEKRRNAGGSLILTEAGKPETVADGWRRYNAIMDKKEEDRKKRRFEESFNGTRKRRYYLAGDDDLEHIAANHHHSLSPRVAYHQLYPADDVAVPPLPVLHPVSNASFPVPAVEEQGDGWVNPEWVNEGKSKERKVIGLGRSLKAIASGVFNTVKGKLKAIWERGQAMKKAQATTPHFKITEQELAELGVNFEDYQKMARQVCEEMGFQEPQEPVVIPDDDDDEEDGDYIDDGDSDSSGSIFTGSLSDDL